MNVKGGSTDVTSHVQMRLLAGGDATGLTVTDFDLSYTRSRAATSAKVDASALAAADAAHADNSMVEVDATDCRGLYRVDWPDAAFAAGVREVVLTVKHSLCYTESLRVEIDPPVSLAAINGNQSRVDNLATACDNYSAARGLAGTALPAAAADAAGGLVVSDAGGLDMDALVASVGNIANVGSPSFAAPASYTLTTGTQTGGTYANVDSDNDIYHVHTDAAGALSLIYDFVLEVDELASSITWRGRWNAGNDTLLFSLYDWVAPGWVTWFTRAGVAGTTATSDWTEQTSLVGKYTGTGADVGKVRCRITGTGLSSCTLSTDQLIVGKTTRSGGVVNGSTVTLAGANTYKDYIGENWSLALGGQDISGSYFEGASQVTGTSTGTVRVMFKDCVIGSGSDGATLPPGVYFRCGFNTSSGLPFTAASAGQYAFVDCYSMVAGSGTPYFTFATVGSTTGINFRRWSGGSHITTNGFCTGTMEVVTGGGQTLVTGGASWELRGICRAVTATLAGGETVRISAVTGPVAIDGVGTGSTVRVYGVSSAVTSTASGSPTVDNSSMSQVTAVGSVTGAVGSVSGNVAGSVGSVASGGITAASIADDAIDAGSVKADAVTKLQAGLALDSTVAKAATTATAASITSLRSVADLILADTGTDGVKVASGQLLAGVGRCAYNAGALEVSWALLDRGAVASVAACTALAIYDFDGTVKINTWDSGPTKHTTGAATGFWSAKKNDASALLSTGLVYYAVATMDGIAYPVLLFNTAPA